VEVLYVQNDCIIDDGDRVRRVAMLRRGQVEATRAQMPPTIDGKLNDAVWKKAQPIGKFMVLESTRASDLKTFGYVAYDDTHLYLAMNCLDSEPKSIAAQVAEPGEEVFRDDRVEIQPYVGK